MIPSYIEIKPKRTLCVQLGIKGLRIPFHQTHLLPLLSALFSSSNQFSLISCLITGKKQYPAPFGRLPLLWSVTAPLVGYRSFGRLPLLWWVTAPLVGYRSFGGLPLLW